MTKEDVDPAEAAPRDEVVKRMLATRAITLEHVLPKSPGRDWSEWTDADQIKKYTRRLGNLCLLQRRTNSEQCSDGFDSKRENYRAAPYVFTSEIADYANWGPSEIEARQVEMAAHAVKALPI